MPIPVRILDPRRGEKGMALILAIAFLAILSILGAVVLDVSTRDLGQSATFMPARQAFYTSDRAVEYSMNRDIILNLSPTETIDLFNNVKKDKDGNVLGPTTHDNKAIINAAGGGTMIAGSVTDLGPNELPPSVAAMYGSEFGANFYHVEVESTSPAAAGTTANSHVNASIVRLFKSDDDTIFRTSGGG